ncbi:MAG: hypothetical protein KAR07_12060 [Spirochaetes bacterium]|nr:hypothetical protein [Spirochaetota bacterium]
MKRILTIIMIILMAGFFIACGEDGPPQFRVQNDTSAAVNISFKQGTNPTVNINGTEAGEYSAFQVIAEGETLVTGMDDNLDGLTFTALNGFNYTVVVHPTDSRIVAEDQ